MPHRFTLVEESYRRCRRSPNFFADFYDNLLWRSPAARARFRRTDFHRQHELLARALEYLILYARGLPSGREHIEALARSHSRAGHDIEPALYEPWRQAMLDTISRHDPVCDADLLAAWEEVLDLGIRAMISGYDSDE